MMLIMRPPLQIFLAAFLLTVIVGSVARQPDDIALPLALTLAFGVSIRKHRSRRELLHRLMTICQGSR